MKAPLLALFLVIALTSCGGYLVRTEFDTSFNNYNDLLRWHDLDKASLYASQSIIEEFMARAKKAKDTRIVDYRTVSTKYDAERRQAKVEVDIDYFGLFSNKLKTIRDTQEWAYTDENGERKWRIVSLLPEFK